MSKNSHGVSAATHFQKQIDAYANQKNPNNGAYRADHNNHSNQCNPNNKEYANSRNQSK